MKMVSTGEKTNLFLGLRTKLSEGSEGTIRGSLMLDLILIHREDLVEESR